MEMPSKAKIGWGIVVAVMVLASIFFGVRYPLPEQPEETTFSTEGVNVRTERALRVDNDLTVGGTAYLDGPVVLEGATDDGYETTLTATNPTADRAITIPNVSGTLMLTQNPGIMVLGVNTVTTTLTITHGLTTPQAAFCTLIQDSEANGATCTTTVNSGTGAVVLKLWKADGATAGSVGKQIAWMVTGQP